MVCGAQPQQRYVDPKRMQQMVWASVHMPLLVQI